MVIMKPKHKKRVGGVMKETLEDSNADYSFLRSNSIPAQTVLRMLALAYQGKIGGETK